MSKREHLLHIADSVGVRLTLHTHLPEELRRTFESPVVGGLIPLSAGEPVAVAGQFYGPGSAFLYGFNPRKRESYYLGLHELGHAAIGSPMRDWDTPSREVVADEARAWLWALDNAKEPLTRALSQRLFHDRGHYFGSYLRTYGNSHLAEVRELHAQAESLVT